GFGARQGHGAPPLQAGRRVHGAARGPRPRLDGGEPGGRRAAAPDPRDAAPRRAPAAGRPCATRGAGAEGPVSGPPPGPAVQGPGPPERGTPVVRGRSSEGAHGPGTGGSPDEVGRRRAGRARGRRRGGVRGEGYFAAASALTLRVNRLL